MVEMINAIYTDAVRQSLSLTRFLSFFQNATSDNAVVQLSAVQAARLDILVCYLVNSITLIIELFQCAC